MTTPNSGRSETLRKVLVVDDAGDFPDPGSHADLVEYASQAPAEGFDTARYATVFVHANNEAEADWAVEHYPIHFVFTGDSLVAPDVSEYEGVYELPRWALKTYFQDFLTAYRERGEVDRHVADIFKGR